MIMSKNEIKETEEKEQVEKFFKTKIGQNWFEELDIVDCIKSESPDFVLKTNPDVVLCNIRTKQDNILSIY